MDTGNKSGNPAIDNILDELKDKGQSAPAVSGGKIDDILSEMGMGKKPAKRFTGNTIPPAPSQMKNTPAPQASMAAPQPPVRQGQAPQPAPQARQAAPQPPRQGQAPQPAPQARQAAPQASKVAPQQRPPAPINKPQAGPAPTPTATGTAPQARPATGRTTTGQPAMGQSSPQATAKGPSSSGTAPARKPAPAHSTEPPAEKPAPKAKTGTMIWDIEVERTTQMPRMGKAAALELVDTDKYVGDSELSRWFEGGSDFPVSKKEQRKAEKELRKQLAAERKEEKLRRKKGGSLEAEEETPAEEPVYEETVYESFEEVSVAFDAFPEEMAYPPPPPAKNRPMYDGSITERTFAASMSSGSAGGSGLDDEVWAADREEDVFGANQASARQTATRHRLALDEDLIPGDYTAPVAKPVGDAHIFEPPDHDTRSFELGRDGSGPTKVPTAAYTQEFDASDSAGGENENKSLFVDEMVDDRFRQFFSETVIMDRVEVEADPKARRKRKKSRSAILTGEFTKLAELAEMAEQAELEHQQLEEDDEFEDYDRPQDAEAIESDIAALRTTLSRRAGITGFIALLLLWMSLSYSGLVPLPAFMAINQNPLVFGGIYLALVIASIAINFTTVATGLVGLFGAPTVDSAPAVASVAGLLQGAVLMADLIMKSPAGGTLFGCVPALILAFNAFGKRVRAMAILRNFQLASSAGVHHSAAYILDSSTELAYNITKGLEEEDPALLVSRPTALVKGFLRQSFSQRGTDRTGRLLGWLVLGISLVAALLTYLLFEQNLFIAISALAAVASIAAPFSSSLVSGVPSSILQKSTARVGAVVPGWSAIEDLGSVNVVMAGARDIFPPSVVSLRGIKTFEKERVDIAILYAASVLIEGCDTLRDIFLGVIQGKREMLYKVESLTREPGRGFTAWVQNNRVVIGSREMLQRHDITPPPMEIEVKHVPEGHMPVYLAVSGRLFAMFIVGYGGSSEVRDTLNGLVKSGVSLLVTSDDMNVTNELIEHAYSLPKGVVKVLGRRELDILEPLTSYMPESDGVMTHIGTFSSFIGGMRSAAGCAASERMSSIVQTASVILACALSLLLIFGGGLATLSIAIALVYQLGWTLLVGILPFMRRY